MAPFEVAHRSVSRVPRPVPAAARAAATAPGSNVCTIVADDEAAEEIHFQYSLTEDGKACITRCSTTSKTVSIPAMLNGHEVVELADGSFANLMRTESISCPNGVRRIGDRAFSGCHCLSSLTLNEGLESLGSEACMRCARLATLMLPATLSNVGTMVTGVPGGTMGLDRTQLRVSPGNERLFIDENLVVYRRDTRGLALLDASSFPGGVLCVKPGTYKVCKGAAASHAGITQVVLPHGVETLEAGAFNGCSGLAAINLPQTLASIGEDAFSMTHLVSLTIPAACTDVTARSFNFGPAKENLYGRAFKGTLQRIEVDADNPVLRMEGGLLCLSLPGRKAQGVLVPAALDELSVPAWVESLSPAALAGVESVGVLRFRENLRIENETAFLPSGTAQRIVVELEAPSQGETRIDLAVPETKRECKAVMTALRGPKVNLPALLAAYDAALGNVEDGLSRSTKAVSRLAHPVHLDAAAKSAHTRFVNENLESVCVHFGARNNFEGLGQLLDAGIISQGNLPCVLAALTTFSATTAVAYLLQQKQQRFGKVTWDYDL